MFARFAIITLLLIPITPQAQTFGDGVAAYSLGRYDRAIEIWQSLATDNADAQYRLGDLYERGVGVTRDFETAADWYRKAAANAHAGAQFALAELYQDGRGVDKSPEAAWLWYQQAAETGSARAQYHVANVYMTGKGVERDLVQAYVWFTRAAQNFGPSPEGSFARTAMQSISAVLQADEQKLATQMLSAKVIK